MIESSKISTIDQSSAIHFFTNMFNTNFLFTILKSLKFVCTFYLLRLQQCSTYTRWQYKSFCRFCFYLYLIYNLYMHCQVLPLQRYPRFRHLIITQAFCVCVWLTLWTKSKNFLIFLTKSHHKIYVFNPFSFRPCPKRNNNILTLIPDKP